ncbi:hypothetical protein GN157_06270 [Flavobacterium rakeshii]|uniref:Uncharacterized protein n=1 Tax=Flavobacterium rakeshii TaxID=1038845 RepID=A0A6N8HA45_9FLAO|nr:hypothetical protein [Flavobacterium rakeshii]MUV03311.1 hypothetical protein [Flavobacterium rakeshii]
MSIYSTDPEKRLFLYQNHFRNDGKEYKEQFYYQIKNVEYNDRQGIEKVEAVGFINLENYLKGNKEYSEIQIVFTKPLDNQVELAVATYEQTKSMGGGK